MESTLSVYDLAGRRPLSTYEAGRVIRRSAPNDLKILDSYFFNSSNLKGALSLLSPGLLERPDEGVAVYFNEVQGFGVVSDRFWSKSERGSWWTPIQEYFLPGVRKMPIPIIEKYFYDSEFNNGEDGFYQIFAHMFGGSLRAFSCFVGKDRPEMTFSSHNYMDDESYDKFGLTGKLPWYGALGDFLKSAEVLEQTLREMKEKGYKTSWGLDGSNPYTDVRLIHPEAGMIVMRTFSQEISDLIDCGDGTLEYGIRKLPRTIILPNGSWQELVAA